MNILEVPSNIKNKLVCPYDLGLIVADIMKRYSHDPKTQTGAAIIDDRYNIYGIGSNCYPFTKALTEKDKQLLNSNNFDNVHRFRLEHAERNAVAFGIRNGNPLKDTIMTVSYTPCVNCANTIANSGIIGVVDGSVPDFTHHRWGSDWEYVVKQLFPACGLKYSHYQVNPKTKDKVLFSLENLIDKYYYQNTR